MRRALATALLTGYAVALGLAALPPEVRPHALDRPSDGTRAVLRAIGIIPGNAVFETGYQDQVLVRADCIRVVARDAQRRATVLAPPGDHCETEGVRLVVPWTEGALRAVILRSPAGVAEAAIGDWACHGPTWGSPSWRDVTVTWTQPYIELRSRTEGVANAAAFVWRCDPAGLVERLIRPTDADLRALDARTGG